MTNGIACWLQIAIVVLVVSAAGIRVFNPQATQPRAFADPGVSVEDYIDRLRNGATAWQRYNAAAALGELGEKRAIPYLIEALSSPDESIRMNAVHALGDLKAMEARSAIAKLHIDSSADVRTNAKQVSASLEALADVPQDSRVPYGVLILLPALVIVMSLLVKLSLYPRFESNDALRYCLVGAWPLGMLLAWLAQRPYSISETRKVIGFPYKAAVLNLESGTWVDYVGDLTRPLLTLDILYGLFSPQLLIAGILGVMFLTPVWSRSA